MKGIMQPAKLVLTWDIRENQQGYVEFVISEFVPGLQRLGFQVTGAWYTQHGSGPEIILTGVLASRLVVDDLLSSEDFQRLREKLLVFVENFAYRLAKPSSNTPF
jgi:hypothetical protein